MSDQTELKEIAKYLDHLDSHEDGDFIRGIAAKLAAAEADAERLHLALETLISVAEKCDGWESFPSDALDSAIDAARGAK